MKKDIFVVTNSQKVLDFLIEHPVRNFTEVEIKKSVKISRSGINYALRDLVDTGFLSRDKRGKIYFYSLNRRDPIVKQIKILKIIMQIDGLLKSLKKISSKIILFGSSSRGENTFDSDIDLFTVSHNENFIKKEIEKYRFKREIQIIVRSPLRFTEMKQSDPVFYEQVNQGIVLWDGQNESRI